MKNQMNSYIKGELQALKENIEEFSKLPQNESLSALIQDLKEVRDSISQNLLSTKEKYALLWNLPLLYLQIRKLNFHRIY